MQRNPRIDQNTLQQLDQTGKDILPYLAYASPPVSIDSLMALLEVPAGTVLNVMEYLKKIGVVYEKKGSRKGNYFFENADLMPVIDNLVTEDDKIKIIRKLIGFYDDSFDDGDEKTLILAELYKETGYTEEGLPCLKKAADTLHRSGDKSKAIIYYDHILKFFEDKDPTDDTATLFLESALAKISESSSLRPAHEQMGLIARAEAVARKHQQWELMARIKLELAAELHVTGESEKASRTIDDFRELARKLKVPGMTKLTALSMSELYFYQGKISQAVQCYEDAVGDLEEFGDDETTLRTGALIGWCYVICGRISRGLGMIKAVRAKARLLNFQWIVFISDLLRVHALLEIRKVAEAEVILNNNSTSLSFGNIYFHLMQWSEYLCRAFIQYAKEDYKSAFAWHKKAFEHHMPSQGWMPRNNPWSLEYLGALESKGFIHDKMRYDDEIERSIKGQDIYMKGFALRYRALKNMETGRSKKTILKDLKESEKYLKMTGAEIELARTRVALGNYYLKQRKTKASQAHLEKAWQFFSTIDKSLFPTYLIGTLPHKHKTDLMMNKVLDINESLGIIREISPFLQRVLNLAMDFSLAMRGAFFVMEANRLKIIVSRNLDPIFLVSDRTKTIEHIMLDVYKTGKEVFAPGSNSDNQALIEAFHQIGIHSFCYLPAKLGKHLHGYLYIDSHISGMPFPEDNLPFMRILCSQIAVGLSNIAMYSEMKALKNRFQDEASFYKQEMGIAAPLGTIIGESDVITKVKDRIRKVASTDSSVLIGGETGVGKELIAKAIHNLSKRKNGPFIPVNLAALPQELVASELFGHEKGAFTGADMRQKGRFELADEGTIFLDEIGDLPQSVQVKLLRILQEGTFERLGSAKPIRSNFRVITAVNKNLQIEIEKGTFRQDLFYRLNVFPIYVPPLRERRKDISLLAHYFVDKYGKKLGKKIRKIPPGEMKKLLDYHWPGNVRELEHFIERAVIFSDGYGISFSGLEQTSVDQFQGENTPFISLSAMERQYIERVLHSTNGKVSGPRGAAKILGLKPTTLFARMKKLGVRH